MSDYDTYSRIHCRLVYTSEDGLRLAKNDDVTKTVTLKVAPTEAGNVGINLPTSAGTLMTTTDNVDSRLLVHSNSLPSMTPMDSDSFLMYDASNSDAPSRVLDSSLKAFIGSGLPSATEGQMLVANSSGVYVSLSLSGDVTVNASGVLSLANDSVGSAQIEASAVIAGKLNIHGATLLSGQVIGVDEMLLYVTCSTSNVKVPMSGIASHVSANLSVGSVSSVKIVEGAITTAKIASDAITTVKIADANVTEGKLASDAVTTAKVLDANITTAKIADANVTEGKLASNAVTTAKIADANFTEGKPASDAVSTAKIIDANVTTAKLADDCVTSAKLAPAIALDTSVEAPVVYIGNNKWKLELSTNELVSSYWNGSAWVIGQTISAPLVIF
jgi:hypothetical protein